VAILIGGEGPGLPPALVDGADERVTIPMQRPVESLNAAVTAALIVYEARRQRSGG
jgi:RNA methyltransferase, TrmH family